MHYKNITYTANNRLYTTMSNNYESDPFFKNESEAKKNINSIEMGDMNMNEPYSADKRIGAGL